MATDDEDDEIVSMQFCDEDGNPIAFESVEEAIRLLRKHVEPGGRFELHAAGCSGELGPDCDCGVEVFTEAECNPKASA